MSKTMTWNYKGEADITLGERHASPLPKILTALIVLAVIVIGILGFIQRDFIYDKLNNPHIVLIKDNVIVQYQSNFAPLDYIDKTKTLKYDKFIESLDVVAFTDEPIEFPYTLVIDSNVDTQRPGQYTVTYHSSNHIQENEVIMNITVPAPKDEVAPTITLTTEEIHLYYNQEDIQTFDPMNYIQSYSDDKSPDVFLKDNITYEISESSNSIQLPDVNNLYIDTSDLDQDGGKLSREEIEEIISKYTTTDTDGNSIVRLDGIETKNYSIEFTIKDESDNSSSAILYVIISLDTDTIGTKLNELIVEFNEKQDEPVVVSKPSSGNNNQNNNKQNNNQPNDSNTQPTDNNQPNDNGTTIISDWREEESVEHRDN